jgi:hypothetical protein
MRSKEGEKKNFEGLDFDHQAPQTLQYRWNPREIVRHTQESKKKRREKKKK